MTTSQYFHKYNNTLKEVSDGLIAIPEDQITDMPSFTYIKLTPYLDDAEFSPYCNLYIEDHCKKCPTFLATNMKEKLMQKLYDRGTEQLRDIPALLDLVKEFNLSHNPNLKEDWTDRATELYNIPKYSWV